GRAAAPAGGERARGPRRRRSPPARTRRASRGRRGAQARGCRERRGLPAPRLRQPCSRASAQGRARPAFRPSLDRERDQRGVSRVRARLDRGPQRCGDAAGQPLPRRAGRGARPGGSGRGAPPAPLGWRHDVAAGCARPAAGDGGVRPGCGGGSRRAPGAAPGPPARAATAVEALGRRLGLSPVEMAQGMVEVANANMLRALRLVSVQRGYDLRDFALIAYGGAGPVHAGALARQAGIGRVVVPAHSGTFSALGCLVSPPQYDAVQTWRACLDAWDGKPAEDRFQVLEGRSPASAVSSRDARCRAPGAWAGADRRRVVDDARLPRSALRGRPVREPRHRDRSMTRAIHPVTLEVVRNALYAIAEEMSVILMRSARSPLLKEAGDLSSALTDADGRLIAQGRDIPIHMGVMAFTVKEFLKRIPAERLREGDVWFLNLPEVGGNHLPDVKAIRPVFAGGRLVAFAINLAHWADIGGAVPGSYVPWATESYQEGVRISPIRLFSAAGPDEENIGLILANIRAPDERRGDIFAQFAADD